MWKIKKKIHLNTEVAVSYFGLHRKKLQVNCLFNLKNPFRFSNSCLSRSMLINIQLEGSIFLKKCTTYQPLPGNTLGSYFEQVRNQAFRFLFLLVCPTKICYVLVIFKIITTEMLHFEIIIFEKHQWYLALIFLIINLLLLLPKYLDPKSYFTVLISQYHSTQNFYLGHSHVLYFDQIDQF